MFAQSVIRTLKDSRVVSEKDAGLCFRFAFIYRRKKQTTSRTILTFWNRFRNECYAGEDARACEAMDLVLFCVYAHILNALGRRNIERLWLWCFEISKFPCFNFFLSLSQGNRCSFLHHCVFFFFRKSTWPRAWQEILISCLLGLFRFFSLLFSNLHRLTVFRLYVPLHSVQRRWKWYFILFFFCSIPSPLCLHLGTLSRSQDSALLHSTFPHSSLFISLIVAGIWED